LQSIVFIPVFRRPLRKPALNSTHPQALGSGSQLRGAETQLRIRLALQAGDLNLYLLRLIQWNRPSQRAEVTDAASTFRLQAVASFGHSNAVEQAIPGPGCCIAKIRNELVHARFTPGRG
jgi:hypothetical protein